MRRGRAFAHRKGGFTLIELLVTLGLILLVAGLAVPEVTRLLAERTFVHAVDELEGQIRLARAEAQSRRTVLAMTTTSNPARLRVGLFLSPSAASSMPRKPGTNGPPETDELSASWTVRRLPPEYAVGLGTSADGEADESPADMAFWGATEADSRERQLMLFLPDGTTLLPREVRLEDDAGHVATLAPGTWAGMPTVRREDDQAAAEEGDADTTIEEDDVATSGNPDDPSLAAVPDGRSDP